MEKEQYLKEINKVGITTIVFNILLSIVKVVGGILAASSSLISDGIHSASDVFSTIVVLIGAKISKKAPDKKHPFGHERFESIGSIVLALPMAMALQPYFFTNAAMVSCDSRHSFCGGCGKMA